MSKIFKLDQPDYSSEYQVICICSSLQDYRLSWHLNKLFKLDLAKSEDFEYLARKTNQSVKSSLYLFSDTKTLLDYQIISNRNPNGFLMPEQKQVDYFFLIRGLYDLQKTKAMEDKIRNIPNVMTAYIADFSKLKDINNILSDLELHLMKILTEKNKKDAKKFEKKDHLGKN